MNLVARTWRWQYGLRRSNELPWSKLKILTQRCLFVIEICTDDGEPFFETARHTIVLIRMTSRVFKVRTCKFSLRRSGRAKTRPARPLATAMNSVINHEFH